MFNEDVNPVRLNDLDQKVLYYMATPYSSPNSFVLERRYLDALSVSAVLLRNGFMAIEPIAMCHQQAQRFGLSGSYDFWRTRDEMMIDRCDAVLVVMMDGWRESVGVNGEIQYARLRGKPIYFLSFPDILSA